MYEETLEKVINEMDKCIEDLKELSKTNPKLARKKAIEQLQHAGILNSEGKLAPPYNGQKVNEDDFTRGPEKKSKFDERER